MKYSITIENAKYLKGYLGESGKPQYYREPYDDVVKAIHAAAAYLRDRIQKTITHSTDEYCSVYDDAGFQVAIVEARGANVAIILSEAFPEELEDRV